MRQGESGRFRIELEGVTDLAMILKFDPSEISSGNVHLMAEAAIEFLSAL